MEPEGSTSRRDIDAHRPHARAAGLARTAIYTNSPLSAGDPNLAVHIQELRDYLQ